MSLLCPIAASVPVPALPVLARETQGREDAALWNAYRVLDGACSIQKQVFFLGTQRAGVVQAPSSGFLGQPPKLKDPTERPAICRHDYTFRFPPNRLAGSARAVVLQTRFGEAFR